MWGTVERKLKHSTGSDDLRCCVPKTYRIRSLYSSRATQLPMTDYDRAQQLLPAGVQQAEDLGVLDEAGIVYELDRHETKFTDGATPCVMRETYVYVPVKGKERKYWGRWTQTEPCPQD